MKKEELRLKITRVLHELGLYSEDAVNLLMGTCAQESHLGKYRRQLGRGPALGIFQMEPATFRDISKNYLSKKTELLVKIKQLSNVKELTPEDLVQNDILAICMARVHYLRVKAAIPSDLNGWATYWKKYYNTYLGKGKEEEFIKNYNRFCI